MQQLTFGAVNPNDFHAVENDSSGATYAAPQWTAGSGVLPSADPVCYTRSGVNDKTDRMTIDADFDIDGSAPTNGEHWEIRATDLLQGVSSVTAPAELNGDGFVSGRIVIPIGSNVDTYAMVLDWMVSNNGGKTWVSAGATHNRVYVAGGNPTGSQLLETVLNTGCSAAAGQNTYNAVVNSIWATFQTKHITEIDGRLMHYWGQYASIEPPPVNSDDFSTSGLIQQADGRCDSWAHFLEDVWGAQGVSSHVWGIYPVGANPPGGSNFRLIGFDVKTKTAQGGEASRTDFADHAVVRLSGGISIYDPSYGAYFSSEQAWRDGSEETLDWKDIIGGQIDSIDHLLNQPDSVFHPLD